jgi:hypothetical protein
MTIINKGSLLMKTEWIINKLLTNLGGVISNES